MKSKAGSMRQKTLQPWLQVFREHAPPINFITIHYAYFILTSLVAAIVLWVSATPLRSLSFTDALFLAVSAMTLAGLNTVNLSQLNTFQQFVLFLLIMLGSSVLVSVVVIYIRRRAFEKRFVHIAEENRKARRSRSRSIGTMGLRSRRSSAANKEPQKLEPKVDGIVVRGRIIQRHPTADEDADEINPGDQPRAERQVNPKDLHLQIEPPVSETQADEEFAGHRRRTTGSSQKDGADVADEVARSRTAASPNRNIRFADEGQKQETNNPPRQRTISFAKQMSPRLHFLPMYGVGAQAASINHPRTATSDLPTIIGDGDEKTSITQMLKNTTIGRNSQLSMLSLKERERLGGVEYQALRMLEFFVTAYFVLFQLLGCIGVGAWIAVNTPELAIANGLNPWWVGAFNAVSAFNNSGMSLLDANMVAFQSAYYVLLTMSLLILAGNTCYPVFLRWIIWAAWKLTPSTWTDYELALRFVLKHPRRVYTNLFPAYHTWFLLGTVVVLNAVDWVAFEVLNIGNPYVESIPVGDRVIDGLFQAFAVRSGGFYVVPIGSIAIGVQVLYVLMMYISVYPVTMTIRNSNVYEERSLGIYATHDNTSDDTSVGPLRRHLTNMSLFAETGTNSRSYFVRQQVRSQLSHDLWWICLAVLLIVIVEGSQFSTDPVSYSVFNIVLEVVSAYGSVGISVGLPGVAYSFCGGWHILSKLILCAVMLRGRHRGLPVAIDRAVLLPSESLGHAEEEDAKIKRDRALSRASRARTDLILSPV